MATPDPLSRLAANFQRILSGVAAQVAPASLAVCRQYLRCLTGIQHPLGNIVIPGEVTGQEFQSLLEEMEGWAKLNQAPVALVLFPDHESLERKADSLSRNWLLLDEMPGMWLEIDETTPAPPLAEGIEVCTATSLEGLKAVTEVLEEGYPLPFALSDFFMRGIHQTGEAEAGVMANFLASVDGEPAACSSVSIEDGVAGIYCVATLERFRGRGLGSAVTRAAVQYAREQGATHALLHASAMGKSVYSKIGFRTMCTIPVLGYGLG